MRKIHFVFNDILFSKNYKTTFPGTNIPGRVYMLVILFFAFSAASFAQGPGVGWEYSRPINLSAATTAADFQVKVTLTPGLYTHMKADGSDLRFYDNSNNVCNYWIEKWDPSGSSFIWVKIPTVGATSLSMYYGNPAASSLSNGNTTFDFFEDFNTAPGTSWNPTTVGGAAVTQSGTEVTLSTGPVSTTNQASISSAFLPKSTSFFVETKHKEGLYYRSRYSLGNVINSKVPDMPESGFYGSGGLIGTIFSNGYQDSTVKANAYYVASWKITDGQTTQWSNYNFGDGSLIAAQPVVNTAWLIRAVYIRVDGRADIPNMSTTIDWVRLRKQGATTASSPGAEVNLLPVPTISGLSAASGCEGSNVTITGDNFQTAFGIAVKIGGTDADIISSTNNQVVAKIGAGTSGAVTVTTNGGTASYGNFTVNLLTKINAGAPLDDICMGTKSVNLGGSFGGGATSATWSDGGLGGTFSPNANDPNAIWTPPANYIGTATLTLTAYNSACGNLSLSKTQKVNPLPSVSLLIDKPTVCFGASQLLTASGTFSNYDFKVNGSTVYSGPSNTYSLKYNDLATGNNNVTVIASENVTGCLGTSNTVVVKKSVEITGALNASGFASSNITICDREDVSFLFSNPKTGNTYKFIVNGTSINDRGANAYWNTTTLKSGDKVTLEVTNSDLCSTTFGPVTVTVNPNPSATITGGGTVCQNGANQLITFTGAGGTPNYTFSYNINGGATQTINSSGNSGSLTVTPSAEGTFIYNLLSVKDATSTACASDQTGTATIIVKRLPTATISGGVTVCKDGAEPKITFTGDNGTAPYTFTYLDGNGATQTVTSPGSSSVATIDAPTATSGTFNYRLVSVKDASTELCSNNQTGTAVVIVKPLLTATITGSTTVCQNSTSPKITFTAANGTAPYTFIYKDGAGATQTISTSAGNSVTIDAPTADAGSFVFTLLNVKDAGSPACSNDVSGAATIVVNPLPTATISGSTSVCLNGAAPVITFTGAGGTANYTFTYNVDGGVNQTVISSGNTATVTAPVNTAGTFVYNLLSVKDASSTTCVNVQSGSATVIVNPLPIITLNGPPTLCQDATDTFTTETGMSNYVWAYNGGTVVTGGGASDDSITIKWNNTPGAKSISVNYTDGNGCKSALPVSVAATSSTVSPTISLPNSEVCINSTGNTYSTEGGKEDYVWDIPTGGTITSGLNTSTVTVTWSVAGNQTITVNYTDAGCTASSPTVKAVKVDAISVAGAVSANQTICSGSSPANIVISGNVGNVIKWQKSADENFSSFTDISVPGNTLSGSVAGPLTATTYFRAVVVNGSCTEAISAPVKVTVDSAAVGGTISAEQTICASQQPADITISGNIGNVINWQRSTDVAFTSVTSIAGASTTLTGAQIGALSANTYYFRAVVKSGVCTILAYSDAVKITVNPASFGGIASPNQTICSGSMPGNVSLTGNTGAVIWWESSIDMGFTSPVKITNISTSLTSAEMGALTATTYYRAIVQSGNCASAGSSVVTITVDQPSVAANLTGDQSTCINTSPATSLVLASGSIGNVIKWQRSTTTDFSSGVTDISNTATTLTGAQIGPLSATAYFRAVVKSGMCNEAASNVVTINVDIASIGGTVSSDQTICSGSAPSDIILSGNTGNVIKWQKSTNAAFTSPIDIASTSNTLTGTVAGALNANTYFRAVVQSGSCSIANSASVLISVDPKPVAVAGIDLSSCFNAGAINITNGASATNSSSVLWTGGTGDWTDAGSLTQASYLPSKADSTLGYVLITLKAFGTGSCSAASAESTKKLNIQPFPLPVIISPSSTPVTCVGTILPLSSIKAGVAKGSKTASAVLNVAIPDNDAKGAFNVQNISSIDPKAIVDSISVQFDITHPVDGDLNINLKAPNGKVLNLANARGGINFTNTIISSTSSKPIQTFGVAPYNEMPYAPQGVIGIRGANSVPGLNTPFIKSFTDLFSIPNGDWIFSVRDGGSSQNSAGTFNSWSITIYYHVPDQLVPVIWSPATDLYTDAAATVPYVLNTPVATVYAKSAVSRTYTATNKNDLGCTSSDTVNITVNPAPTVKIIADYCAVPNRVTLIADPVATSYNWSTGESTRSILVDVAHTYYVSTTNAMGCVATAEIDIAQELVVNGDFEQGNVGFISPPLSSDPTKFYQYRADITNQNGELQKEGLYGIGPDATAYHNNFWGRDHTSGTGNFMIINGYSGAQPIVWQQTVTVKPNTMYYFSAWGMSLNNVGGNYPMLQFNVNNKQVGSVATLPRGSSDPTNTWKQEGRFYGNWFSDTATVAVISITDLQTAPAGNDFGIDDISFATLSPFVSYMGAPGLDNQVICLGDSIQPIPYLVGSGLTGPTVDLPSGMTYIFDGRNFTIVGAPTVAGTYTYTIKTNCGGVVSSSAFGKITVKPNPKITLTSSSSTTNQVKCIGDPIANITYAVINGSNAVPKNLPPGINLSYVNGAVTIYGNGTAAGIYNYSVIATGDCHSDTLSGIIEIAAPPVGGTLSGPASICVNDNVTLTLGGGYTGSIDHWEVSNDNWATYSIVNNTTNTQLITGVNQSASYRVALKTGAACALAYSTGGDLKISNLWEGKFSSDWSNKVNWSDGKLPSAANCLGTVTIAKGINYDPVIQGNASVRNLNITSNGHLIINGGKLQVAGTIVNAGIFNASLGAVEFNGSTAQSISGSEFDKRTVKDLIVSNGSVLSVSATAGDTLKITGTLSFGNANGKINTGNNITLVSNAAGTASVAAVGTGNTITGNVTVERYINIGKATGQHAKAWEFITAPVTGVSVKNSWMEGGISKASTGYGTQVTGKNYVANGFDMETPSPSVKYYDAASSLFWVGIPNSDIQFNNPADLNTRKGYMIFVRGDRSVSGQAGNTEEKPTTLRASGKLITGPVSFPVPAGPNTFASIGNPYASAVDMRKLSRSWTADVLEDNFYYVWNSNLDGNYGLGVYQHFVYDGTNYIRVPGNDNVINNNIQSGQAFFVQSTGVGGSLNFNESSKVAGSNNTFFRVQGTPGKKSQLRNNLYKVNTDGTTILLDGTWQAFNDSYSNGIDGMDGRKLFNSSENISIKSGGRDLIAERRKALSQADTIFFGVANLKAQNYQFQFIAKELADGALQGYIEDTYLKTSTPLNMEGQTLFNFTVTNVAASYASSRFRIVFKIATVLPVTYISLKAYSKKDDIVLEWNVENEHDVLHYEVEKSLDGNSFTKIKSISAKNTGKASYNYTDEQPVAGYNYYRVHSTDKDGKTIYTNIVKVTVDSKPSTITIFPNPIVNGIVNLKFVNQPAGKYGIRLLNSLGQTIISKQVERMDGSNSESLKWDYNLAHGIYNLEITKPNGEVKIIKVMY